MFLKVLFLSMSACCFGLKNITFWFEMEVVEDFQKSALALAIALVYFYRKTSMVGEYSSKVICDTVNSGSSTRSLSYKRFESDLEALFGNISIRKILKSLFPGKVSFERRCCTMSSVKTNRYKILTSVYIEYWHRSIFGRITAWRNNGPTSLRSAS